MISTMTQSCPSHRSFVITVVFSMFVVAYRSLYVIHGYILRIDRSTESFVCYMNQYDGIKSISQQQQRRRRRPIFMSTSLSSTTNNNKESESSIRSTILQKIRIQRFVQFFIKTKTTNESNNNNNNNNNNNIVNITTLEQLNEHWGSDIDMDKQQNSDIATTINYDTILRTANVMGDTQIIGSSIYTNYTHPVVQLLHLRRQKQLQQLQNDKSVPSIVSNKIPYQQTTGHLKYTNSTIDTKISSSITEPAETPTSTIESSPQRQRPWGNDDGCKVALAIEGGGMRGCVSAGMVCAIHYLNLTDVIDVIYGSSAGTIVGAYLITKQLPYFGPEVYYDRLTTAGTKFIDTKRILRAIGFGIFDPRLLRDVLFRRSNGGKPVLNLSFLLKTTVQQTKPLDWDTFAQRQSIQPLHVVTSGLNSNRSIIFTMANQGFTNLDELTDCMHASCLLPGIAGPIMNVDKRILNGTYDSSVLQSRNQKKLVLGNNLDSDRYEPIADALLYEPLPYRTAITQHNVTHCIVLRTRPDGTDVTGKGGLFEKLIFKRFFQRKNKLQHQYRRMRMHLHKKIYAENIIQLNHDAYNDRDCYDTSQPHLMTVAIPPGSPEIGRLEVKRDAIFAGIRRGFARAYDCLVDDPKERGRGEIVAQQYFPDEILEYDPLLMDLHTSEKESAFAAYLRLHGISPKAWDDV